MTPVAATITGKVTSYVRQPKFYKQPLVIAMLVFLLGQLVLWAKFTTTETLVDHNRIGTVEQRLLDHLNNSITRIEYDRLVEDQRKFATHEDIGAVNKRLDDLREILIAMRRENNGR